ncbi:unnamed protein product [Hermetia illucens]|uniref:Uncharacterized protein n=2 Tax=Hermetia illucens TaxID=343691 RepID=A0A7R8YVR5_HERIL|nr:unnamed protein product [Hermetia illucens]
MPKEMKFLDSIIHKEDIPTEKLNETKRRFSISRSGRFKSKNRQREALDMNLFNSQNNVDKNQNHHNTANQSITYSKHNKDHAQHHSQEVAASGY